MKFDPYCIWQLVPDWETHQLLWIRLGAAAAEYYTNSMDSLQEISGQTAEKITSPMWQAWHDFCIAKNYHYKAI